MMEPSTARNLRTANMSLFEEKQKGAANNRKPWNPSKKLGRA